MRKKKESAFPSDLVTDCTNFPRPLITQTNDAIKEAFKTGWTCTQIEFFKFNGNDEMGSSTMKFAQLTGKAKKLLKVDGTDAKGEWPGKKNTKHWAFWVGNSVWKFAVL